MAFHPSDSPLYRDLFGDPELAALFTDAAEVRAMLLVEAALAKAQATHGVIPMEAAQAIERAAREATIDPSSLSRETAQAGDPVHAMLTAFRYEVGDPTLASYVHYGVVSQDIIDTALMLRLRQALTILGARLSRICTHLRMLAASEADTVMMARGQIEALTTFGAQVACWADPLVRQLGKLPALKAEAICLSLAGNGGTRAALGPDAGLIARDMADALRLTLPDQPWHSSRDRIVGIGHWLALVSSGLGRMAQDVREMTHGEVRHGTASPVAVDMIITLARANADTIGSLHHAQLQGAAWVQESLSLSQMMVQTGAALRHTEALLATIEVDPDAAQARIAQAKGRVYAQAAKLALGAHMNLIETHALVTSACDETRANDAQLRDALTAKTDLPVDWDTVFNPLAQLGDAPARARAVLEV